MDLRDLLAEPQNLRSRLWWGRDSVILSTFCPDRPTSKRQTQIYVIRAVKTHPSVQTYWMITATPQKKFKLFICIL